MRTHVANCRGVPGSSTGKGFRQGEAVRVGISTITVLEISGGQIKRGCGAPEEFPIQRQNARQKVPLATVTYIHCDPQDGASAV